MSDTASEPLPPPNATVALSEPIPTSIERQARSETSIGRHRQTFDENVLPSIEPENDPFTALQTVVNDTQRTINRELKSRIHWENEARRLRHERDRARNIGLIFYHDGEASEQSHLQTTASLRTTQDALDAANEARDVLASELDRANDQCEQLELERNHFESERDRFRDERRDLLVLVQVLRNQLVAAGQPAGYHQLPLPPTLQVPIAARPVSPLVSSGRARSARFGVGRQGGRDDATVALQPAARGCKVEKGKKKKPKKMKTSNRA